MYSRYTYTPSVPSVTVLTDSDATLDALRELADWAEEILMGRS